MNVTSVHERVPLPGSSASCSAKSRSELRTGIQAGYLASQDAGDATGELLMVDGELPLMATVPST
ncbi:MAG: hypothetical protein H0V19_09155 [Euzebyales bacterium]|nr:hypothetical protein [Euzebyales bacterium]MBA3621704.1 hypothetical protein [Euzebyales bacterium]